jgi:ketosteroid isomerase-like protein
MPGSPYAAYADVEAYFDLVRSALADLVDGEHFFDTVADGVVYEVLYDFPGWPRVIRGRAALMAQFGGYAANMTLHAADHLVVHRMDSGPPSGSTVVIEYEVHGQVRATGVAYDNRFASIIRIEDRKIAHWRDYMDSLAAWNALTAAPAQPPRGEA